MTYDNWKLATPPEYERDPAEEPWCDHPTGVMGACDIIDPHQHVTADGLQLVEFEVDR
jgi:hypothetical protein